ncbi:BSD domain-containing protein 1-like [Acipenser oxyrinchus oxyrinchus]|uniref:BSD domain-containing protein 1-like n=1 Tax=Acipenser oxyrinchus oxyrinchus TaxID=40147 RepID=A0AAD8CHN8_ACIOX|nr:BSD domain-containing protein 1-like [Acipenser oxyrinchus oxyrinchus]
MPLVSREGGWWGGWLQQSFQSVKDKSAEAYDFIKRDLAEFTNVVQHDTACTIAATASAVKDKLAVEGSSDATQKVKKGLSNILGVITDTLAPPPDKTIDCDVITLVATSAGTTEVYDSTKARLYSLQADPATYCNEPDGPPEVFEAWLVNFNFEEKKAEVSELLVSSPSIRALYSKMVPVAVSHSEFWQRYFYKIYQLDQEEARRIALKQRAEQTSQSEELGWEEEDEFLGAASSSRLDFKTPEESSLSPVSTTAPVFTALSGPDAEMLHVSGNRDIIDIPEDHDVTPSISSESVTLITQIENLGAVETVQDNAAEEIAKKLTEASLEEADLTQSLPEDLGRLPETDRITDSEVHASHLGDEKPKEATEAKATAKPETVKEDGPTDLRVFELNSDSGKSTPSNNGKKGSSTDISEDWEKDFDLDMTEEEVQLALSKVEASGEMEEEDWDNWE